jgi:8-oxo-dGTP pyrophosphatase MutT (NUDIX family)
MSESTPAPSGPKPRAAGRTALPAPWVTLSQTLAADCSVYRVWRRHLRHTRDNREGDFYILEAPDWVQALALTPRHELLLVRQWRFGVSQLSWEPPGGVIDAGEDIVAAAQRELLEETGHAGQHPVLLGRAAPNPALQNNRVHFVLIENCVMHAPMSWDPHEELQVTAFPLPEVEQMIRRGQIFHSLALNAIQFLQAHLAAHPLPPHS